MRSRDDGSLGVGPWWGQLVAAGALALSSAVRLEAGSPFPVLDGVYLAVLAGWTVVILGAHYRWPWVMRLPGWAAKPAYGFDHQRSPWLLTGLVVVVVVAVVVGFAR